MTAKVAAGNPEDGVVVDLDPPVNDNNQIDLSPEEKEMAIKHGLIEKPEEENKDEDENNETDKNNDDKPKDEDPKADIKHSSDLDTVFEEWSEDPEKEHSGLQQFTTEQRSFYYKWKKDKHKRQEAEAKYELLELENNKLKAQLNDKSRDPLDRLFEEDEANKPVTKKEYQEDKQKQKDAEANDIARKQRMAQHNAEAKEKYSDYSETLDLAMQVMKNDSSGVYWKLFIEAVDNPKGNSAEVAYKIGKLHPDYGTAKKVAKVPEGKDEDKVTKMIENAQKGKSSSSIPENQTGKRNVPEAELTVSDCSGMTTKQWLSLKRETRDRLLRESCA